MVDLKKALAKLKKKITGSLSLRVFIIATVLLIIPLLIHSVIAYRHEYRSVVKNIFTSLGLLGEMQANNIGQKIALQDRALDAMALEVDFEREIRDNFFESSINPWLANMAKITSAEDVFYLAYQNENSLLCVGASHKNMLGQNFITKPNFFDALHTKKGAFVDVEKNLVYITKTIFSQNTPTAAGLLCLSIPASFFIEDMSFVKDFPYKIDLSIMKSGTILASTNSLFTRLSSKKDFELIPMKEVSEAFDMRIGKTEHIAAVIDVEKIPDFFILLNVEKADVLSLQKENFFFRTLLLLVTVLLFGGGGALWITLRISAPLHRLLDTMNSVALGDVKKQYIPDPLGFEINILGNFFNGVVSSMVRNQMAAEKERVEKQVLARELKLGHDIQKEMLPTSQVIFSPLEISFGYLPAKEVSGDFFDLFPLDEDRLLIVMADTSGKGIPACFYSLTLRSILRSFAEVTPDIKDLVEKTNELFCIDTKDSGIFVTSWIGIYDRKQNALFYTNAGHYPAILKRKNALLSLTTKNSIAFGVDPKMKAEVAKQTLEKDDLIFLYTDGILEAQSQHRECYGKKRFEKFIETISDEGPKEIVQNILNEVNRFSVGQDLFDDLTILVMRF